MSFLNSILKIFVGDKSKQDVKKISPIVNSIISLDEKVSLLTDDQLRNKTQDFKSLINNSSKSLNDQIVKLESEVDLTQDFDKKENLYNEIDKLKDEIYLLTEETLNEILPEAYAVIKETAKRFKNNKQIKVKANNFDREISGTRDYVNLDDDYAIWNNSWDAAGKPITWDMVHYDVQLIGGIAMHQGKIAEMQTGEGKTLVATLPVYLNALSGKGVHLVAVNDYLAKRDSAWMAPIYEFHGLSVDCIDYY